MKKTRFKGSIAAVLVAAAFLWMALAGCAGQSIRNEPSHIGFQESIDRLIAEVLDSLRYTSYEIAPVAVMPGSLRSGSQLSRLEEMIIDQLKFRLRENHEVHSLSRKNWFEYREGRPLAFQNTFFETDPVLNGMVILEVQVTADEITEKGQVNIIASAADSRPISGITGKTDFEFYFGSMARDLYFAKPKTNPYPEGLEERPYKSLDRLCFSLSSELAGTYRKGVQADRQVSSDQDVRVLLFSKSSGVYRAGLIQIIQNQLQQAIVGIGGFSCVLSKEDFGPALTQIEFYKQNRHFFELEESIFSAGTVLLMAEISPHHRNNIVGVALRAAWRISPLESRTGELIPTNVSGTYLSGFTAKAYLDASVISVPVAKPAHWTSHSPRYRNTPVLKPIPSYQARRESPTIGNLDVCFFEFTNVMEKRIYILLTEAPGVSRVKRQFKPCNIGSTCICYTLNYAGSQENLEFWLKRHLRTSHVLAFRTVPRGDNRLDVIFNGGFE
jgi:hypothetical protein